MLNLYIDGIQRRSKVFYRIGQVYLTAGNMSLGSHDSGEKIPTFRGDVSQLNVWHRTFSVHEIKKFSKSCVNPLGSLATWQNWVVSEFETVTALFTDDNCSRIHKGTI